MNIFLAILNLITLIIVVYLIVKGNEKLYQSIEKTQEKYFDSLEKNSQKVNILLEKNSKEFLKVFVQIFKKDVSRELPKVTEVENTENSIEKASAPEEVLLSDTPRIPIVEGINIKFEDEEEIYPVNIEPIEDTKEDKKVNPIEK